MAKLFYKKYKINYSTYPEIEIIRDITEKLSYVSLDYLNDLTSEHIEKSYELPDGNVIVLEKERFMVPELLFQPSLNGIKSGKFLN
jgi:actin-related protein